MIAWSSLIRWVNGCGPEAKPADSFVGCNISQKTHAGCARRGGAGGTKREKGVQSTTRLVSLTATPEVARG